VVLFFKLKTYDFIRSIYYFICMLVQYYIMFRKDQFIPFVCVNVHKQIKIDV